MKTSKEASFWELLADKKGEKFIPNGVQIPDNNMVDVSSEKFKSSVNSSKSNSTKQENTSFVVEEKTTNTEEKATNNEHLKKVSFWELLKDKKGEKYAPVSIPNSKKENNSQTLVLDVESIPSVTKTLVKPSSIETKHNRKTTTVKSKRKKSKSGKVILFIVLFILVGGGVFVGVNWQKTKAWASTIFGGNDNIAKLDPSNQQVKDISTLMATATNNVKTTITSPKTSSTIDSMNVDNDPLVIESENGLKEAITEVNNNTRTSEVEANTLMNSASVVSSTNTTNESDLKQRIKNLEQINQENKKTIGMLESRIEAMENKLNSKTIASTPSTKTRTSSKSTTTSSRSKVEIKKPGKYNVIVGSYSTKSTAKSKIKRLSTDGFDGFVVDNKENGLYRVSIGSFESRSEAEKLERKYQETGKSVYIKEI